VEYHEFNSSFPGKNHRSDGAIEFLPLEIIDNLDGTMPKLKYGFKVEIPHSQFSSSALDLHRFITLNARAWFQPDIRVLPEPYLIASPSSLIARAYIPPHGRSHTMEISLPKDLMQYLPPETVPFNNEPTLSFPLINPTVTPH